MAKKKGRNPSLKKIVTAAKKAIEDGKYEQVLKYTTEGLQSREGVKEETLYSALVYHGTAATKLGRYADAKTSLSEAVSLFPDKLRAWRSTLDLYVLMDPQPALNVRLEALQRYAELTAKKGGERHLLALLELAGTYLEGERYKNAHETLEQVKENHLEGSKAHIQFLHKIHRARSVVGLSDKETEAEIKEVITRLERRGAKADEAVSIV